MLLLRTVQPVTVMEPVREDPPVSDAPFFTKDAYDQYSLAPSVRELWSSLQSPAENASGAQSGPKSTTKKVAEFKNSSNKDDSPWDAMDTDTSFMDDSLESPGGFKNPPKANVQMKNAGGDVFPQPRLPFPCVSSLSSKEQRAYVDILCKKSRDPPEHLKARVDQEVMQFQRYLQDVAKVCADDYNFISQGALQYAEDYLRARLEQIQTLPQLYQICEMTSLTGGTFNPGLCLTFEKQLVVMGSMDITSHVIMAADAQLATDYQSVSSENPPAKKAKDIHAAISSDDNAEKLCARYEPHVCLTREALVTLLDNHGPDFAQRWELPVTIQMNHGKGVSQKKTVYIESALIDNEITVRQKTLIYHEESLKLSIIKNGTRNMSQLMTELPSLEGPQRNVMSLAGDDLDFGVDVTDLETFGEVPVTRWKKTQNEQLKRGQSASQAKQLANPPGEGMCSSAEDLKHHLATEQTIPTVETNAAKPACESEKESDLEDDNRLIIDDSTPLSTAATPSTFPAESVTSPKGPTTRRQASKRAKGPADQLGEILRMQTATFSTASDVASKSHTLSQESVSPTPCVEPPRHTLPLSLVKPCVTSYLERNRPHSGESSSVPPVIHMSSPEKKKILSQELQAGAENQQDYTSPESGNLMYELFSLQDVLIVVRSSVSLARKVVKNSSQFVPVHVLPKLEYQLCHGVECLTSSEACQLWTETALHATTVSFVAHINPHTSKVALLRRLPDAWRQNSSCGFNPVKSLNILHHLLKKLTKMEEGQYLITHKPGEPFVTFLKVTDEKVCRTAYDLHRVHGHLPRPPENGPVPWIPVDPTVVLPFHKNHGRVPCTFPPQSVPQASIDANAAGTAGKPGGKKKKKKKKKNYYSANRNNSIQKVIQHPF
ncbi:little elongation complex subunit 2 [Syngnathus acus]|uniref:little elongation complex subunit 2 n=1 Tax=Syngnathus acus TaxID=161584 RepID=UPI001885D765|nr:little elongation complex subunit 2 [Syngnathus acus]XP_037110192.1 little elongation complex subunit 2 [Syngnathus acus]